MPITGINILFNLFNGFIKLNGTLGAIFSRTNDGIITSLLLGVAGWMLFQY